MSLSGYEVVAVTVGPFGYTEEDGTTDESGTISIPDGKRALGVTSQVFAGPLYSKDAYISADGTEVLWQLTTYGFESPTLTVLFHVTVADVEIV
jgi:hypothetical protein